MLATSGSTGAPRLVRHSGAAVAAAATAIVKALHIGADDVAVTSLPLFHTLGLSVLHSHLLAGATVVLEPRGVLDVAFWATVERHRVTTITGVPHTFELLARLPWEPARTPGVRSLAVSGGRLRDILVTRFAAATAAHGGAFFAMYGQTEAGSRISVLPPEHLPAKAGCARAARRRHAPDGRRRRRGGVPLGNGDAGLRRHRRRPGPRRRPGRSAAHRGPWPPRRRRTPVAVGRLNRIGKAYGVRVDLDAVEHTAATLAPAAGSPATTGSSCGARGSPPRGRRTSPRSSAASSASTAPRSG